MALCHRLARLRARSGLSLGKVARRVACSKAHLWELEKGKTSNPSLNLANRLAGLYGVSLDYLANGNLADWIRENTETMQEAMEAAQRAELLEGKNVRVS